MLLVEKEGAVRLTAAMRVYLYCTVDSRSTFTFGLNSHP